MNARTIKLVVKPLHKETKEKFDDIGDLLFGETLIVKVPEINKERDKFLMLMSYFRPIPWQTLRCFGVDVEELTALLEYSCPFTENKYYWFVPTCILVRSKVGTRAYRQGMFKESVYDYLFDLESYSDDNTFSLSQVQVALLGHGYTDGTLPHDGSCYKKQAAIALDNGDYLLGWSWVWFNK